MHEIKLNQERVAAVVSDIPNSAANQEREGRMVCTSLEARLKAQQILQEIEIVKLQGVH